VEPPAHINPETILRRRLRRRWPNLLALIGMALLYVLVCRANWPFVRSYFAVFIPFLALFFFIILFRADRVEDEEPRHPDLVCLTFPDRFHPPAYVCDFIAALQAAILSVTIYFLNPKADPWTLAGYAIPVALIAIGYAASLRKRTVRRRYVSLAEYNLACEMIDPALSLDQNAKRLRSYTWGEPKKVKDITRAALGLVPVTLPAATPYPR
jgi:hypothetical protein